MIYINQYNVLKKKSYIFIIILAVSLIIKSDDNISNNNEIHFEFDNNRYGDFIKSIRCPVCQGQSIADSNAGIAQDLKKLIKKMMVEGNTDQQIEQFILDRYGDFILLKPRFSSAWLLWIAPIIFILLMLFILFKNMRK